MYPRLGLLLLSTLLAGCAQRKVVAPATTPPGAVRAMMEKQARNALIAGEGDAHVQILRQRLALAPAANEIRVELAEHYEASGFPDVALEMTRAARERDLLNQDLLLREVRLLRKLDLPQEAADVLGRFEKANPDAGAAVASWLGITLDEAGQLDQGEKAHRRAIAMAPQEDSYRNNLGYNLLSQGRYAEAAKELSRAIEINRRSETTRSNLALALAMMPGEKDAQGAVAHWRMATDDAAAAHSNLAAAYIEQGQYKEARQEIGIALGYRRNFEPALRNLELAAKLDGGPAAAEPAGRPSLWRRFTASMKRTFVRTEETVPGPKTATRQTATR